MIKHLTAALCAATALSFATAAFAQDQLPRRAVFGAALQPAPDGGALVMNARDGSPAAAAGFQQGDIIRRFGDRPINSAQDLVIAVREARPGTVPITFVRDGVERTVSTTLIEAPREAPGDLTVTYESVRVDDGLRRTIVTAPRGPRQRQPALLLLGGIGCYSIDDALNTNDAYRTLAYDLARRGVVVVRIEKSGIGDSQGAPCGTVDFDGELRSYDAAIAAMRADRRIDASQIFLFGHSIGTVGAPELAQRHNAAGVIAAQGVGRTWMEYILINNRRQIELSGASPADTDAAMIATAECGARLLMQREPAAQVLAERPECQELIAMPASQDYMAQLTQRNIAQTWADLASPALLIYGDSDFLTDAADHQRIVDIVNAGHPGNATLAIIEDMDHYLVRTESQESSMARAASGQALGDYDPRFSTTIGDWLCARARCSARVASQ